MDKNHGELIEYLDEKFARIDIRIDKLENKVDSRFNQLLNSIDKLTKSIEIYHHEQIALDAKVDRLEKWINQVAKKVGIELRS
ncbi:MAG: hypothetical protein U9Q97_02655 [Acidobacteriota bacterium]|nr:hypothetical protein [Acidobacteriota bacterium]